MVTEVEASEKPGDHDKAFDEGGEGCA